MEVVGVEETGVRGHLYLAAYSAVRNEDATEHMCSFIPTTPHQRRFHHHVFCTSITIPCFIENN